MSRKSFGDILLRNIGGFFEKGFPDIDEWKNLWVIAVPIFIVTLPLTLILVGIKTLIDYFSRKEISEDKMSNLVNKIESSSQEQMDRDKKPYFKSKLYTTISIQYPFGP